MLKERKHVYLRAGDTAILRRLHPDLPISQVIRILISDYVDRNRAKLPTIPKVEVDI